MSNLAWVIASGATCLISQLISHKGRVTGSLRWMRVGTAFAIVNLMIAAAYLCITISRWIS